MLSIIGARWASRLQSSRYWDNHLNEDCGPNIFWFLPIVNTLYTIVFLIAGYCDYIKNKTIKWLLSKAIRWLLNKDLID